mmetsp:Transcript_52608/g.132306  ORF Transcript_52608/g.132306 Transcript_52608/m.132306 type:complete len:209 (+) Transcript_52608:85-711(+)
MSQEGVLRGDDFGANVRRHLQHVEQGKGVDDARRALLHHRKLAGLHDGGCHARVRTHFLLESGVHNEALTHLGHSDNDGHALHGDGRAVLRIVGQLDLVLVAVPRDLQRGHLGVCQGGADAHTGGIEQVAGGVQHQHVNEHGPALLARDDAQGAEVDGATAQQTAGQHARELRIELLGAQAVVLGGGAGAAFHMDQQLAALGRSFICV